MAFQSSSFPGSIHSKQGHFHAVTMRVAFCGCLACESAHSFADFRCVARLSHLHLFLSLSLLWELATSSWVTSPLLSPAHEQCLLYPLQRLGSGPQGSMSLHESVMCPFLSPELFFPGGSISIVNLTETGLLSASPVPTFG